MSKIIYVFKAFVSHIPILIKNNKTLISNFLSLSVLQFLNLVLPLATLPYLVRVIGIDLVGLLAFCQAFVFYFQIVTEYGFNLTTTREISLNIDNRKRVEKIYNEVMTTKFFLFSVSGIVAFIIILSFDYFRNDAIIYFLYFLSLFGLTLFPVWFFQGVQQMKYITYINLIAKVTFTIAIFIFVNNRNDYILVPLFLALGNILAGVISLFYLFKKFNLKFKIQSFLSIKKQLNFGKFVFLSQLKISLFSNTNTLVLGFIAGNESVGLFNVAEKVIRALASLQIPVVNTLFPYISQEIKSNLNRTYLKLKKISWYGTYLYLIILIPVFIFADKIIALIGTKEIIESANILRILIVLPVTIFLNNMFGTQILLNLNKDKLFFKIILFVGLNNLLLVIPLTYKFDYIGTAIGVLITEILLFILMWFYGAKEIRKLTIK